MNLIDAPLQTIRAHFALWADAFAALFLLGKLGLSALLQGKGAISDRLKEVLAKPEALRAGFAVLRAFQPNLTLRKTLVTAYESQGTAIVTRANDVYEVLDREADFSVVYEPKMRKITAGENFFLGMQNTAQYQHDVSLMRLAMRREDVEAIVVPLAREKAESFAAAAQKRIDLPHELTRRIPAAIVSEYLGVAGAPETDLIDWVTVMFWYLFVDIVGLPEVETRALAAAKACRDGIDAAIAARKQSGAKKIDVLGRCLELQAATPEFDDVAIRDNLIGLLIGAIPTISKASCQAVDQLLDRPKALAGARAAALKGDTTLLGAYIFEALRFNPLNPLIYRRANRDVTIAASTLRQRRIRKDTMVMASNLSLMFDPLRIERPQDFRIDRPWGDYMLWGYGFHSCFGAYINRAVIPVMLRPVLARDNLRRAAGAAGQMDGGDTPPFPQHFVLESD
jgi:cytochrome P450